jgi:hypothetical protein
LLLLLCHQYVLLLLLLPDERGQHQMHIHVAPLEPAAGSNILFVAKEDNNMETDLTKPPTHHTVNGHTVAAYFFKDATTPPTSLVSAARTAECIVLTCLRRCSCGDSA